ncbi:centromere kinetochore component CENP-T-domain-containing protein [Apodospora peruviana]|uniref:Centromere kinetochore component CENP-T-domain-containing protein n=1 Tax=Apodospora peruviana TaxID=516989 RepID=A0AAE0MGL4_9PEZI|nr:centromere kinetochore component CENP-T-domain-containing protein [Apodospora peruviana]
MARESRPAHNAAATPARQPPVNSDPLTSTGRPSIAVRTPGSQGRGLQRPQGLSASGRKAPPGPTATPHARAAFRTIDSRRAAIFTPHRTRRRSGQRDARETPRNFLLPLGRVLARNTQPITTSSSSPGSLQNPSSGIRQPGGNTILEEEDEDDYDDEELPKRPRLSLPIDVEDDDDSPLQPHRSAGLEDENFTVQSIELPRRAISEQPGRRLSLGSVRMSDYYFNANELRSEDVGIDSGFFPPMGAFDEDNDAAFGTDDEAAGYDDRQETDVGRRESGRESDFGIVMPGDMNESTFVMAPQLQDSPTRPQVDFNEPMFDNDDPRSDDGGSSVGGGGHMIEEDWQVDDGGGGNETTVGVDASEMNDDATVLAKSAALQRGGSKSKKRCKKVSKHGIEYPALPPAVVKRLAQTFAKTSGAKGKITPDELKAIMQASEWFFEQLGDDLEAYAKHAHRKTIDESDMLTLMKRQRQTSSQTTPFALAQRYLPRELLQELRMTPAPLKKCRKANNSAVEEDEEVT